MKPTILVIVTGLCLGALAGCNEAAVILKKVEDTVQKEVIDRLPGELVGKPSPCAGLVTFDACVANDKCYWAGPGGDIGQCFVD